MSILLVMCEVNSWAGIEPAQRTRRKIHITRKHKSPMVVVGKQGLIQIYLRYVIRIVSLKLYLINTRPLRLDGRAIQQ